MSNVLLIYSDGGPGHRLDYVFVLLSLIVLYLNFDLDMLIACRTAPKQSWRNPVERMMSIINLGLQCIEIMRAKLSDECEEEIKIATSYTSYKQHRLQILQKSNVLLLKLSCFMI